MNCISELIRLKEILNTVRLGWRSGMLVILPRVECNVTYRRLSRMVWWHVEVPCPRIVMLFLRKVNEMK